MRVADTAEAGLFNWDETGYIKQVAQVRTEASMIQVWKQNEIQNKPENIQNVGNPLKQQEIQQQTKIQQSKRHKGLEKG